MGVAPGGTCSQSPHTQSFNGQSVPREARGGKPMGPSSECALLVCSLPPDSAPAPGSLRGPLQGLWEWVTGVSLAPGPFPAGRVGAGGSGGLPRWGGARLPRGQGHCLCACTSACLCAGHPGSLGSGAGGEGTSPPSSSQGSPLTGAGTVRGPPPPTSPQLKSPLGLCCCYSY